jgi:hypothetical protein
MLDRYTISRRRSKTLHTEGFAHGQIEMLSASSGAFVADAIALRVMGKEKDL